MEPPWRLWGFPRAATRTSRFYSGSPGSANTATLRSVSIRESPRLDASRNGVRVWDGHRGRDRERLRAALERVGLARGLLEVHGDIVGAGDSQAFYGVRYHGTGGGLFVIVFENLLLTIVTFGVYLPWARTERRKYLWQNLEFDRHRLRYHGTGREMLMGYLKVLAGYLAFLGLPAAVAQTNPKAAPIVQLVLLLILLPLIPIEPIEDLSGPRSARLRRAPQSVRHHGRAWVSQRSLLLKNPARVLDRISRSCVQTVALCCRRGRIAVRIQQKRDALENLVTRSEGDAFGPTG